MKWPEFFYLNKLDKISILCYKFQLMSTTKRISIDERSIAQRAIIHSDLHIVQALADFRKAHSEINERLGSAYNTEAEKKVWLQERQNAIQALAELLCVPIFLVRSVFEILDKQATEKKSS